jgi:macrolide transport system ATP-binding/permease protein
MILVDDLRFACRQVLRSPGFALAIVLTLALCIGANTAIFSIFDAWVLRAIPARDPGRVIDVYRATSGDLYGVFSYPEYTSFRDRNTALAGLAAFTGGQVTLTGSGAAASTGDAGVALQALLVSGNYFSMLGIGAERGRMFSPEEDRTPNAHPVVVLSHDLWQRRFGEDPNILGTQLSLNGVRYTVVGIAPETFGGTTPDAPDLWVPLMMAGNVRPGANVLEDHDERSLRLIGRLAPNVTRDQAQAQLSVLARNIAAAGDSASRTVSVTITPGQLLDPGERGNALPVAGLLLAAVALVLLIACANIANVLLARAADRQREIGIRLSLGASRGRLVRQLMTETMVLALAGGAAGSVLALWLADVMVAALHPPGSHRLAIDVHLDSHVLGYTLLLSVVTGIACGLAPALRSSKQNLASAVKDEWNAFGQRVSRSRLRGALVVTQVAVSLVLLVGAGLLVRALQKAQDVAPGFDVADVQVISADLELHAYDSARAKAFQRDLATHFEAMPGVKRVALARNEPLGSSFFATGFAPQGLQPAAAGPPDIIDFNIVSPGYFDVLGIPIVRGRTFTDQDITTRARVAIVSEALARRYWPGENPIGKRFNGGGTSAYREVIGVAKDARNVHLWTNTEPYIYVPLPADGAPDLQFFVRTEGNPAAFMATVPATVRGIDSHIQVTTHPLAANLALWIWPSQIGALLSGALGLLALLLASAGIYAVVTNAVTQRTREIGIRLALGARHTGVLALLLRDGMRLVTTGVAIGLVVAAASSSILSRFLYGLSAFDVVAFAGVSILLSAVAFLACWIPARRVTRVDPAVALRYQ